VLHKTLDATEHYRGALTMVETLKHRDLTHLALYLAGARRHDSSPAARLGRSKMPDRCISPPNVVGGEGNGSSLHGGHSNPSHLVRVQAKLSPRTHGSASVRALLSGVAETRF
jgi:hypothetical protein